MAFFGRTLRALGRAVARRPRATVAGRGVLAAGFILLTIGAAAGAGGVLVLGGALLAVAVASFAMTAVSLRGVRVDRFLPPRAHAGEDVPASARVSLDGRRRACGIVLADGVEGAYARPGRAMAERVFADQPAVVRYLVRFRERGRRRVSACEISTRHPLGLFEKREALAVESGILVLPRRGGFRRDPLPGARFARRMTCGETSREKGHEEFAALREYRPGDDMKLVAWKASARHARLMVRELEDDLSKKVTLFLETRLPPEQRGRGEARARVERAISFAGELTRVLARRNYRVELVARGPDVVRQVTGRGGQGVERILEALAVLEPGPGGGIDDVLAAAGIEDLARSMPIFVLPEVDEERVRAALGRIPGPGAPILFRMDGQFERSAFHYREG